MLVRWIIIRTFLPLIWKISHERAAKALHAFSVTEIDSAWQSLYAMRFVPDPKLRAKLFQHALEEMHHGALFARLAHTHSTRLPTMPVAERVPLFEEGAGKNALVHFFAHEAVGERNVGQEFKTYLKAAPWPDVKAVFQHVYQDEKGHALYTTQAFTQLTCHSPTQRRIEIVRVHVLRGWDMWIRLSKKIGHLPSSLLLGCLYFSFGWCLKSLCYRRVTGNLTLLKVQSPA